MSSFCQDRLGTNIGKAALKKGCACFAGADAIGSIIPREKLVLGVAWYQMRFMCEGPGPFPGCEKRLFLEPFAHCIQRAVYQDRLGTNIDRKETLRKKRDAFCAGRVQQSGGARMLPVRNAIFAPFLHYKRHHFTKTGPGQT
jgi:hypothetical protein